MLTNACSVLVLSTSNRLGRSVDRARQLNGILEKSESEAPAQASDRMHLRELIVVQKRTVVLMKALRSFYSALGGFASSALVSLFGALLVTYVHGVVVSVVEFVALAVGLVAVCSLIVGCYQLFYETRMAVTVLEEQAASVQAKVEERLCDSSSK